MNSAERVGPMSQAVESGKSPTKKCYPRVPSNNLSNLGAQSMAGKNEKPLSPGPKCDAHIEGPLEYLKATMKSMMIVLHHGNVN